MYTASQLLAHLVGDYMLQSDWMAANKQKPGADGWLAATYHAVVYTLPFLLLTETWGALLVITVTHLLIDRYRIAAFVGWAKNFLGPPSSWLPWSECKGTGYAPDKPPFISVWLLIITDNTMHVLINGAAIHYLG